jgi:hypothetical protein
MYFSFFVYIGLIILLVLVALLYRRNGNNGSLITIISVLLISSISGIRYDVGVDYMSYLEIYNHYSDFTQIRFDKEIIYNLILSLLASNEFHYAWFFFLFSIIQFTTLYLIYTHSGHYNVLKYLPIALFGTGYYFTMMNEIRQVVAVLIFIYMLRYIHDKRIIIILLLSLFAFSFHYSAIYILPIIIVVLMLRNYVLSPYYQILIFVSIIVISGYNIFNTNNYFISLATISANLLEMENYVDVNYRISIWEKDNAKSIRYYSMLILYSITLLYSNKLNMFIGGKLIQTYTMLNFFGSLFYVLFYNNTLLQRPARYFTTLLVVLLPYYLYYFVMDKNNRKINGYIFLLMLILCVFIFVAFVVSNHHTYYKLFWHAN